MKVRMFDDGSAQFIPEPGDGEYPVAPVLPPKDPRLEALEANEADVLKSGSVDARVDLMAMKMMRERAEKQHGDNQRAFRKIAATMEMPDHPDKSARLLSGEDLEQRPWALTHKEQVKRGFAKKAGK